MRFNIFDKDGTYLGVVHALDAEEALHTAREKKGMIAAEKAEPREVDDVIFRESHEGHE
jgi:hypothetical protein